MWFCREENDGWSVHFTVCQDLELFQWKLSGLLAALKGNADIIEMCVDRWRSLKTPFQNTTESLAELRNVQRQLKFHEQAIVSLSVRAQATAQLVGISIVLMTCSPLTDGSFIASLIHVIIIISQTLRSLHVIFMLRRQLRYPTSQTRLKHSHC